MNEHATDGNIITAKLPYTPNFEDIFPKVKPLLIKVHQAFEEAVPEAKEFFESQEKNIDRYLFPNIVRYYVKDLLESAGFAIEMDEDEESVVDYQFQRLVNNGLSGTFKGFRFRILKADRGQLPVPGPSKPKQQFYNQQLPLHFGMPFDEYIKIVRPNLIVLWEVDAHHDFLRLRLACPKTGGVTRDSVQDYFNEPVPHAAELVKSKATEEFEEDIQVTKREKEIIPEYKNDIR